jgi:hypothetical protein
MEKKHTPGGFKALVNRFTEMFSKPQPGRTVSVPVAIGQQRKLTRIQCDHRVDCYLAARCSAAASSTSA